MPPSVRQVGTNSKEGERVARGRLAELYMPQVDQFGMTLERRGAALVGSIDNERAAAQVVVYRLGHECVVTAHRIQMRQTMPFYESNMPGLCVSTLSADSLAMCPIAPPHTFDAAGTVAVFGHAACAQDTALYAGQVHNATSVTFLPDWFSCFDASERRVAHELLGEPGSTCVGDTAALLNQGMHAMTPLFGGALLDERELLGRVVATARGTLAWFAARTQAERASGTRDQARLVRATTCFVAQHLGEAFTLDELARDLLTSRSRLCAAFQQERGESLGGYIRRQRMERAWQLLERGEHSITEVAHAVGYPRASSFTVAFERAYGLPPRNVQKGDSPQLVQ